MKHRSDNGRVLWVPRSNPLTSAVIATVVIGTADYNSLFGQACKDILLERFKVLLALLSDEIRRCEVWAQ